MLLNIISEAEDGMIPLLLAERLTWSGKQSLDEFLQAFDGLYYNEFSVIRSVLDLLQTRNDDVSQQARQALDSFWKEIAPISMKVNSLKPTPNCDSFAG